MVRLVWFPGYVDWERRNYTWEIRGQTRTFAERGPFAQCVSLVAMCQVNEASLTLDKLQSSRGNVNSVVRGTRLSSLVRVAVKREWTMLLIPSEARLYPGSIEIFRRRRRRRQPEVGLKTSISQQWSTGSLSDWQA